MNTNTICLRIFFVLVILLVGSGVMFLYAMRVVTPIAICALPTETAKAQYAGKFVMMEYRLNSTAQLYHSPIVYAGHTAMLLTTVPPTPLSDSLQELMRLKPNEAWQLYQRQAAERAQAPPPEFDVRYVRAFPSLVVRDLPGATLWSYYADGWTARDFTTFIVMSLVVMVTAVLFFLHLRNSSRRYRR